MAGLGVLTRVKFCGMCRPADAALAAELGADYVGVILTPGYTRARTPARASEIYAAAGATHRVGVFVDPTEAEVLDLADAVGLDVVQLHGEEPGALVERLRREGLRVWKAIRPRSAEEYVTQSRSWAGQSDGLLVDGWSAQAAGGTGSRFDWNAIASARERAPRSAPFIAAGGLRPDNVAEAIRVLRPDVVDVSSGVESAPGEKSAALMREFMEAVRAHAVLESSE